MTKNMKSASQTMEQLFLQRDATGDITFVVDSDRIRAHRYILAASSSKYKAQFYGPMKMANDEIRVENVSAAAFTVFLQFFYKETIDLTTQNIEMVLNLAKQSLVDEFIESCCNFIKHSIKPNQLIAAYQLAILYDLDSVRVDCEPTIIATTNAIFASDDFRQCDRNVLLSILKLDTFICTEIDVFNACLEWARTYCKENDLDEKNPKHLRTALGNAIYQIRFSSISANEFAAMHKLMNGLFMPHESIELFYITAKLKDFTSQTFNIAPRNRFVNPQEVIVRHRDDYIIF